MTWYGRVLLGHWMAQAVLVVWMVGYEHKPITPGGAVGTLVITGLLVWGLLAVGTGTP